MELTVFAEKHMKCPKFINGGGVISRAFTDCPLNNGVSLLVYVIKQRTYLNFNNWLFQL